jgi:hypothetical protein
MNMLLSLDFMDDGDKYKISNLIVTWNFYEVKFLISYIEVNIKY